MVVLDICYLSQASRKHYCTNKYVCGKENVDDVCKLLLKDTIGGCLEFKNANKVRNHPSLQIGGCFEVHDIEDLVSIGQRVKGCSYFAAQTLAAEAQLVFCPYSYIINPIVRRAMDVDIKGSILILDEAHNVEDMARDGGTVDIEEDVLHALQAELGQLCMNDNLEMTYRPLYDVIQGIVGWINIRKDNLQRCEFEHYLSTWTGDKAKQQLQQIGISQQYFPVLQECATKAIKAGAEAVPGETHLTGISLITLEGLFSSLSYFFSGNGCHANDYQLALQRYVKRDGSNAASDWTISLSLWCLNPAVVFKEIADLSLSVILTSGTLSPLNSFSSELGVRFDTCMEAPHVINAESQLWAAVVSSGVGNIQLNASYRSADSYAFQDSLGATLEEICKIVPGGALVFFPSYKLLEKLHARWHKTGQWSRLNAQKEIFIEPKGSTNEFEPVLRGYYDVISGKSKAFTGKNRLGLKRMLKHSSFKESHQNLNKGAAFLAVCRGKVSEGIDFSDDNARVVVIVGIPFPNKNDIQVMLKKKFNDTYKSSKNLLSGSEWYCHQAFRALNQAAGRCIRHRFDYGAIILLGMISHPIFSF
ncbi:Fanconi anemia group J protein homolog [Phalaenopsis equestris]|uniref:Fanconi anemia group J protein homolog n=1 Tax=Phalaenopsis equestris TaxID=78828 RepID=UPI0009E3E650|nr:Fanconi anemia group J protein homolog [Phalaenopsis equestris]